MSQTPNPTRRPTSTRLAAAAVACLLAATACDADDTTEPAATTATTATTEPTAVDSAAEDGSVDADHDADHDTSTTALADDLSTDLYLGEYALVSDDHGSTVTVTLTDTERSLVGNGLPNHDTGDFPNSGNPNSISEQTVSASFPLDPVYSGEAEPVKEPGLSIAGVKFDPQTAETATCSNGTTYRIEAVQDVVDLGLDMNNAHVQPTGAYHYHGVSSDLVDAADTGGDLVHVGFAYDGHLIVYSKGGEYSSSYQLSTEERAGADCAWDSRASGATVVFEGTTPDGSFVEDWEYVEGAGELDECNGIEIDGEYVYLLTDEYPYVPRCLMGEFDASQTGPGGGGNGGPPPGA